ncbi:MAG TPA: hypothetical protein VG826_27615 [Pirellulales bacterium]|nr:hypothetical protein [Pirellulales bacterium]
MRIVDPETLPLTPALAPYAGLRSAKLEVDGSGLGELVMMGAMTPKMDLND